MPLKQTEAILLRSIPYLESNAVLKTFTPLGMMDFMAYGIKKKQPHLLNPGTLLSISYYDSAKNSMNTIKEVNHLIKFRYLLQNVQGMIFLEEFAKVIYITGKEAQPYNEFKNLIINPLRKIDQQQKVNWILIPWLIIRLLKLSGLLDINRFSRESQKLFSLFSQRTFDDIIENQPITAKWHMPNKVSDLIISLANYYQQNLKNKIIATELRKLADRILRY